MRKSAALFLKGVNAERKSPKRCIQDYFNIINMYILGFRNITINDKTSTGVMVVCLGPIKSINYNIHIMIQSTFESEIILK